MGRFKLETRAPGYERTAPPRDGSGPLFFIFSIGMIAGATLVLLAMDQSEAIEHVMDLLRSGQ
jgi:hypothetical protein